MYIKLTITKKMAEVHFSRMHCGRKSFKKANGRLLKAGIRQEVNIFVVLKFLFIRWFPVIVIQSFVSDARNAFW